MGVPDTLTKSILQNRQSRILTLGNQTAIGRDDRCVYSFVRKAREKEQLEKDIYFLFETAPPTKRNQLLSAERTFDAVVPSNGR